MSCFIKHWLCGMPLLKSGHARFCRHEQIRVSAEESFPALHVSSLSLSRVLVTKTGFGLVIGFINNPQVLTTINSYMVTDLHTLKSLHTNLLSLSAIIFTYLLHRGYTSLTHSQYHCTIAHIIFYFTCTISTGRPPVFFWAPGLNLLRQLTTSRGYLLVTLR
jgi:hypothetical protein